jgi:ribosome-associated heat shock protein Hsp15
MAEAKPVRIDQYLWAIRLFKSRSIANDAISGGKVKLNGEDVKPSKHARVGDVYSVRNADKKMTIQISGVIAKRVQYSEAILNYYDVSTEEDKEFNSNKMTSSFYTGKRLSKTGRPTKKEGREIKGFYEGDEAQED